MSEHEDDEKQKGKERDEEEEEEEIVADVLPKKPGGYSVGRWKNLDNFQCDDCPYASLEEARVLSHRSSRHGGFRG